MLKRRVTIAVVVEGRYTSSCPRWCHGKASGKKKSDGEGKKKYRKEFGEKVETYSISNTANLPSDLHEYFSQVRLVRLMFYFIKVHMI
jgi:hypothetical protein